MTIPHLRPDARDTGATTRPPHTLATPSGDGSPSDGLPDPSAVMVRARSALVVARLCVDELRETRRTVQLFGTRRPLS